MSMPRNPDLTEREREVVRALCAGGRAKVAARNLGIALKTVENHVQNIYEKWGINTHVQLGVQAVRRGVV
jgi:DNA-binding NarL/FixJ family response regulator